MISAEINKTSWIVLPAGILTGVLIVMGMAAFAGLLSDPAMQQDSRDAVLHGGSPALSDTSCANCGVVERIRVVRVARAADGTGVVMGESSDNWTAKALFRPAVSAYAGDASEYLANFEKRYRVTVRMQDGSRTVSTMAEQPASAVGDRVRVTDAGAVVPEGYQV